MKILFSILPVASGLAAAIGMLAGTGCSPKAPEHGTAFLVEVDLSVLPPARAPQAVLAGTRQILSKRLNSLGVKSFIEVVGTNGLQLKVGQLSPETLVKIRNRLRRSGWIDFRFVHEETESLLKQGVTPPGYELKQEVRTLPDGTKQSVSLLVEKKPQPGCSGRNIRTTYVARDRMDRPEIGFRLDEEGTKAFADLTATHIGRRLAILIDGEVYSAPIIQSPIPGGTGVITGSFTEQEAFDLANLLQNPLEAPIKLIEETSF